MGKRWRKEKANSQEPKRRKPRAGPGDTTAAGGALGGMRRLTRGFFAGEAKSGGSKFLDTVLWVAIGVVAAVVLAQRC